MNEHPLPRLLAAVLVSQLVLSLLWPAPALAEPEQAQRLLAQIEGELRALGLTPSCEIESPARARCSYAARSSLTERALTAHAIYSADSDTVQLYVERYLAAPPSSKRTPSLLARLMELNDTLLIGKLSWNPHSGEVRLSAVLSSFGELDRRAFRATVEALDVVAARYAQELRALAKL